MSHIYIRIHIPQQRSISRKWSLLAARPCIWPLRRSKRERNLILGAVRHRKHSSRSRTERMVLCPLNPYVCYMGDITPALLSLDSGGERRRTLSGQLCLFALEGMSESVSKPFCCLAWNDPSSNLSFLAVGSPDSVSPCPESALHRCFLSFPDAIPPTLCDQSGQLDGLLGSQTFES